jgi:hypothetical protein
MYVHGGKNGEALYIVDRDLKIRLKTCFKLIHTKTFFSLHEILQYILQRKGKCEYLHQLSKIF